MNDPGLRPLHERLQSFQSSTFDKKSESGPSTDDPSPDSPESSAGSGVTTNSTPAGTIPVRPSRTTAGSPAATSSTPLAGSAAGDQAQTTGQARDARTTAGSTTAGSAAVGSARVGSATGPIATTPVRNPHALPLRQPGVTQQTPAGSTAARGVPETQVPSHGSEAKAPKTVATRTTQQGNVLFARKSPVLGVETVGPRKISVGKESTYEVTVRNTGEVAAAEVVVFVNLPAWADVVGAETSCGATNSAPSGNAAEPFQWRIGRLEAKGREKLVLRIVPRESRPFDLGIRWDYRPEASQTMIEVQEPRLAMNVEGPREVLFGQKEIFKLHIANTGTGAAENVMITLMPMGTGDNRPVSHNLGVIQAGQKKAVEVELTARQVGDLTIKVEVRGDGGVHAELAEKVLVRRPALQVDVLGPKVQFVGAATTYQIRVSNPGTATARNVELSAAIPPGAKYIAGVDGARLVANGTKVAWTLPSLDAGAEQNFSIQCDLGLPGSSRLEVLCNADGDLNASAAATTRVEAIADLVLQVQDPTGPILVGDETAYEVQIRNRGTKDAQNIEIVTYFSRGIEPVKVEGGRHTISPGQVVFNPIVSVPAGADVTLRIAARATVPGNHVFRAEVQCKPLGTKLVSEETTYFYQDDTASPPPAAVAPPSASPPPAGIPSSGSIPSPTKIPLRTTDRRQSAVPPMATAVEPLPPVTPQGRFKPQGQPAGQPQGSPAPNTFPGGPTPPPAATYGQPTPATRTR